MVIFMNLDGSCENVSPQHVYQGSNNVTDITVVAPFPSTTAMQIGFILPDGLYWQSTDGARYAPMEFVEQDIDNSVCVWRFVLSSSSITLQQGDLLIAINAVTSDGNTTSYLCKQEIEESVLPNLPSAPEPSVYELLQLYLARLDGRTANVANLVASVQKVAPNAITYTDNKGVVSAPIVIEGGDTAPIPVNAASTIGIPESAWQPVYSGQTVTGYTLTIAAAQHGQMRDGATVSDLWLSFAETESNVISGAYQGYTVGESGDITINVNQPVAMTVRVWNGKGLVDEVARDMVEQETERAESEEERLQEQITELQNTGVDVIAREQIAAETDRAEQAEQTLQTQITEETNRATDAENVLASDIQGLREDITNESHFRGMFDSIEALKAAYPTATPNDYAYVVRGNIWIWQDNEWTDSEEPTPNTAIPLSDSTPLMDGVASAGTSSAGSRSDHRHPSDTTKVNKSGDTMTGSLTIPSGDNQGLNFAGSDAYINVSGAKTFVGHWDNKTRIGYTSDSAVVARAPLYENDERVYSPNNPPPAQSTFTQTEIYNAEPPTTGTKTFSNPTAFAKADFIQFTIYDANYTASTYIMSKAIFKQIKDDGMYITLRNIDYGTWMNSMQFNIRLQYVSESQFKMTSVSNGIKRLIINAITT